MDWGNDYFTFSDRTSSTSGASCGSSTSEVGSPRPSLDGVVPPLRHVDLPARALQVGSLRQDRADPSLFVRLPLLGAAGRVARDLDDDTLDAAGERRGGGSPRGRVRAARERRVGRGRPLSRRDVRSSSARGARSSSAGGTKARSTTLGPGAGGRASGDPVGRGLASRTGPGSSTSRPGAGPGGLRAWEDPRPAGADAGRRVGPLLRRVRLAARALDGRVGRADHRLARRAGLPRRGRPARAPLSAVLALRHAADLAGHRRLADLGGRDPAADPRREREVEWTPAYLGKRMDDWLRNMGDWNISRRRYYGLPLPFYPCSCGHLNVIGSRAELEERALGGLEQLEELRRPWIDEVPIRCEACGEEVRRVAEVGDVWLDAGIVPFSTLGWQSPELRRGGLCDRRRRGPDDRRSARPRLPGRSGSRPTGSRRCASRSGSGSTRSSSCRSTLTGRAPFRRVLGYEKMLDETGREMHELLGQRDRRRATPSHGWVPT